LEQQATLLGRDVDDLSAELAASRQQLFDNRTQRIHPHKDDKVIVAWNALMIEAFAAAGAVLQEPCYSAAACRAADFIHQHIRRSEGRLHHTWRRGVGKGEAFLDDYAYLACALVTLYESTGRGLYLQWSLELIEVVLARFGDKKGGGFFYTADDHEQLLVRNKEFADNAVPSGNAMAALALTKLAKLTGREEYRIAAESTLQASVELMQRFPSGSAQMLQVVDLFLGPTYEFVYAETQRDAANKALVDLQRRFLPRKVLAYLDSDPVTPLVDLLTGKSPIADEPTLYICEDFTCQEPVHGEARISQALDALTSPENT
jgi:uncharacterized protein YyaL (SSP411 family)